MLPRPFNNTHAPAYLYSLPASISTRIIICRTAYHTYASTALPISTIPLLSSSPSSRTLPRDARFERIWRCARAYAFYRLCAAMAQRRGTVRTLYRIEHRHHTCACTPHTRKTVTPRRPGTITSTPTAPPPTFRLFSRACLPSTTWRTRLSRPVPLLPFLYCRAATCRHIANITRYRLTQRASLTAAGKGGDCANARIRVTL